MIPGEIITAAGDIELNAGAETVTNRLADIPRIAEAFKVWDGIDS
mgnify:CR=1 FL=1